jgi:hypothetical protein
MSAFAAGGIGMLFLIGPLKQSDEDPNHKTVASQVQRPRIDKPVSSNKLAKAPTQSRIGDRSDTTKRPVDAGPAELPLAKSPVQTAAA